MNDDFSLEDALIILKRRIVFFLVPILVLLPAGLVTIMLLPPIYKAQGKILIESQQIPVEWVQTTINAYAEERIQTIGQRVMTRNRLLEVADKYSLFPKELGLSESERVERMRQAFSVGMISSTGQGKGRKKAANDNTIAFTVSYSDRSPEKAFQVANEFMTLFLSEDVRSRTDRASTATEFFTQETRRLADLIDQTDDRIAKYKSENADALPENLGLHRDTLIRAQEELTRTEAAVKLAEEELSAIQTQIATYLAGVGGADGPAQELQRLKTQLAGLRADKTESHPDVRAVRDQIRALERQLAPSSAVQKLRNDLAAADTALRDARRADPVDETVLAERREAAARAREALSAQIAREAAAGSADLVMTQLQGRMDTTSSRLGSYEDQIVSLRKTISDMQDRIARTPIVERGLSSLTRDYQNLMDEYNALRDKQSAATLSANLEGEQKSEKFTILEPAQKPDKPTSPNRGQLIVLLIAAALGAGIACAVIAEIAFSSLRGRRHLEAIAKEPPIAIIPYIEARKDRRFALPRFARPKAA
jgi:polysaccharide biosynthesis transport protein